MTAPSRVGHDGAMKLQTSVRYAASPDQVRAMLADPAFRRAVAAAQDARSADVSIEGGTVVLDMVTPNTGIPGFAKAFAGETTRSITREEWTGDEATFSVETPGKPTSITGTRRLVAEGDATLDVFDAEVRAKVPLVGGKIENLMAAQFQDGTAKEHAVGVAWLAGDR